MQMNLWGSKDSQDLLNENMHSFFITYYVSNDVIVKWLIMDCTRFGVQIFKEAVTVCMLLIKLLYKNDLHRPDVKCPSQVQSEVHVSHSDIHLSLALDWKLQFKSLLANKEIYYS